MDFQCIIVKDVSYLGISSGTGVLGGSNIKDNDKSIHSFPLPPWDEEGPISSNKVALSSSQRKRIPHILSFPQFSMFQFVS